MGASKHSASSGLELTALSGSRQTLGGLRYTQEPSHSADCGTHSESLKFSRRAPAVAKRSTTASVAGRRSRWAWHRISASRRSSPIVARRAVSVRVTFENRRSASAVVAGSTASTSSSRWTAGNVRRQTKEQPVDSRQKNSNDLRHYCNTRAENALAALTATMLPNYSMFPYEGINLFRRMWWSTYRVYPSANFQQKD